MTIRKHKFVQAVTLVEVMAAMVVLVISSIGALSYQYYAARDAQKARSQIIATRVAQLLLEDWKSTGGSSEYNPKALGLGFSSPLPIPSHFSRDVGQSLGSPLRDAVYDIVVDDVAMMVMLTWSDVAQDEISRVILRQLNVTVMFGSSQQDISESESEPENLSPVILTTYVRVDGAGG